jgi:mannan endo-1,4-beta-mannosidase
MGNRSLARHVLPLILTLAMAASGVAQFDHFVTRKADTLFDGETRLRFISFNTPNLHYLEDYLPFEGVEPFRLPDEFEIRDALTAVKQSGGKVTRIYVLSVRREDDPPGLIRHVEGPGRFNEDAFRVLDKALQVANEVGIRLIIPFVDNWHWWGGPREYAGFRGKPKEAFWTDPEVIADLKTTIKFLITRKNTYTGTFYRDDKAILAWETGNEMEAPFSWTREIAAYIKSLDTNHLLAEGTNYRSISRDALEDPNLDILTTHHYGDPRASLEQIVENQAAARGRKPYIVGEYGIVPLQDIYALTDTIINQGLAGGMIWSLRFRNREGGFYHHFEYNGVESYRWPGFKSGDFYNERMVVSFLRDRAYRIDGQLPPRMPVPAAPVLLPIRDPSRIAWQGSAGAEWYEVQRREENGSDWMVIAPSADESQAQCRSLFADESALPGAAYHYRVRAANGSGSSDWSNEQGPVACTGSMLVDELEDFSKVFQKDGSLQLLVMEDLRKAKEDKSRLTGADSSYVMYKAPAYLSSVRVEWLKTGTDAGVVLSTSRDLREFLPLECKRQEFSFGKNDYGFYDAEVSSADSLPVGARFVKIMLKGGVQIGRVELTYGSPGSVSVR